MASESSSAPDAATAAAAAAATPPTPDPLGRIAYLEGKIVEIEAHCQAMTAWVNGDYRTSKTAVDDQVDRLAVRGQELYDGLGEVRAGLNTVQQAFTVMQAQHNALHNQVGGWSSRPEQADPRKSLVDPKFLVPEKYGKDNREWHAWARKVKRHVNIRNPALRQAMDKVERLKVEVRADDLTGYGLTSDEDLCLGQFLSWALEGEAWEIYDGCESASNLEAWRRLSQRYAPVGPATQLTDTRRLIHPPRVSKLCEVMRGIQTWENLCSLHRERHGEEPLSESMKKVALLEMVPKDLSSELEAQLHLFPSYHDLRTRIEEITVLRASLDGFRPARGDDGRYAAHNFEPADFQGDIVDDNGDLLRLERGSDGRFRVMKSGKGSGKGGKRPNKDPRSGKCFRCDGDGHRAAECSATHNVDGTALPPKKPPGAKGRGRNLQNCETEENPATAASPGEFGSLDLCLLDIEPKPDPMQQHDPWSRKTPIQLTNRFQAFALDDSEEEGGEEDDKDEHDDDDDSIHDRTCQHCTRMGATKGLNNPVIEPLATPSLSPYLPLRRADPALPLVPDYIPSKVPTAIYITTGQNGRRKSDHLPLRTAPLTCVTAPIASPMHIPMPVAPMPTTPPGILTPKETSADDSHLPCVTESPSPLEIPMPQMFRTTEEEGQKDDPLLDLGTIGCSTTCSSSDDGSVLALPEEPRWRSRITGWKSHCRDLLSRRRGRRPSDPQPDDAPVLLGFDHDREKRDADADGYDEAEPWTVDSGASVSCANPKHFPDTTLVQSPGSLAGLAFNGPGSKERIPNLGQLDACRTLPNGQRGMVRFQAADIRKPLLAVSGTAAKGNMTIFDKEEFGGGCIIPANSPELAEIRRLIQKAQNRIKLELTGGTYRMRNWKVKSDGRNPGFTRRGA